MRALFLFRSRWHGDLRGNVSLETIHVETTAILVLSRDRRRQDIRRRQDDDFVSRLDNKSLSFLRLRLPPIGHRFVDLDILYHVPDNVVLDVIGLVVYAGRPVRMRKVPGTKTPGFFTMRWVALRDSSSTRVTMLELYACSDPQAWEAVVPGRILVCTNVRVKSLVSNSKGLPARLVYLTTTENSQVSEMGPCT